MVVQDGFRILVFDYKDWVLLLFSSLQSKPIEMIIKESKTQFMAVSGLGAWKQDNQTVTGIVLEKSLRKKHCWLVDSDFGRLVDLVDLAGPIFGKKVNIALPPSATVLSWDFCKQLWSLIIRTSSTYILCWTHTFYGIDAFKETRFKDIIWDDTTLPG